MVPAGPRAGLGRAVGADALVEHAPGAEGGLGLSGPGAALADERGLLVAGHAGDDRPPGEDLGRAHRRRRSRRWSGSSGSGMRRAASISGLHPEPSPWIRPVTPALDGVGDVERARPTGSRPPRCRRCRRPARPASDRVRSGSAMSSRAATLVAEALGATRMPWPWSSRQVPTVRRSCHPSPGPTGTPVARSHTMVDARWLAMPTASTGPPVGQARPRPPPPRRRPWPPRRTRPVRGTGCRAAPGRGGRARRVPSGRTTAPRTPEVPTSTTRMLTARAPRRTGRPGRACPG